VFNIAGQERVITEVAVLKGAEMIDFERVEDPAFGEYREKTCYVPLIRSRSDRNQFE
jgi:hypothetical protein